MNRNDYRQKLLDSASSGAVVLTANKRLARYLAVLFGMRQEEQGREVWLAPNIFSFDAWLGQTLSRLGADHRVLKPSVALRLWEKIILDDTRAENLSLLRTAATARLAAAAHDLLTDYAVLPEDLFLGEDHRAFLRWRQRFTAACREGHWIDPSSAADWVAVAIREKALDVGGSFLLTGFDEITPRLGRLTDGLIASGGRVAEVPAPTGPPGEMTRIPCADSQDEVRTAARWARRLLEEGRGGIGIVVPELTSCRGLIERIFLEEIEPAALLAVSDEEKGFDLSLGAPLDRQGPVASALALLGVGRETTVDGISLLLRSPYLRGAEREGGRRAAFDRFLRSLRRDIFSLSSLHGLLDGIASRSRPVLPLPIMKTIVATLLDATMNRRRALPGYWANEFSLQLNAVGWPGERALDSREFQVVQAWREKLLPELAALDLVSGPLTRNEAVAQLRQLAGERDFQPETSDSGLQVCGVLEAGGLEFDHLWVLGLQENVWPTPPRPNPFLPVPLQIANQMPHCDAARESVYARRVMVRLQASAPDIVFSHPLQEGDCHLRPSPLIAGIPIGTVPLTPVRAPGMIFQTVETALETLIDDRGPPLAEGEIAQGGTAVLRDQALCPFRAFAHHRLAAQAFETSVPGLDSMTRGTLVHSVMEHFWRGLENHAALRSLTEEELRLRIDECVEETVTSFFAAHPPSPADAILRIETGRLQELLREWVEGIELNRSDFTIAALEEPHSEEFGGLRIRTKIDRIDLLPDQGRLIIDYKTGRVRLDDLLEERLLDPQLPVYASGSAGKDLAGVAIGQLRRGDCAFRGIARNDDLIPKTKGFAGSTLAQKHGLGDWDELQGRWRSRLESLGRDFAEGRAVVDPVDLQKACRTCDQAAFCRIAELQLFPFAEGDDQ